MKIYIILAISIIALLGFSVFSLAWLNASVEEISQPMEKMIPVIEAENWQEAGILFDQCQKTWDKYHKLWPMLIDHPEIGKIEEYFISLNYYLKEGNSQETGLIIQQLLYLLTHIAEKESINIHNIF